MKATVRTTVASSCLADIMPAHSPHAELAPLTVVAYGPVRGALPYRP
jgi:hypothetical protein